jgi:hypothetical protein
VLSRWNLQLEVAQSEAQLFEGREAYRKAEEALKLRRAEYERAQAAATEKISQFNLDQKLPGHVKEYAPRRAPPLAAFHDLRHAAVSSAVPRQMHAPRCQQYRQSVIVCAVFER